MSHPEVLGELSELADGEPFQETLCAQLVLALYRNNRQVEALSAYQRLRRLLGEEAGLEPSQRLKDLELAILQQNSSLDRQGRGQRSITTCLDADVNAYRWRRPVNRLRP
ncbi:BTAD domain-containing putative transcriptional regulator [Nocardia sp. NPDC004415]